MRTKDIVEQLLKDEGQVHVTVKADYPGVEHPLTPHENGTNVFVLSMQATSYLVFDDEGIKAGIRVNQCPYDIELPWGSIVEVQGKTGSVFKLT